MHPRGGSLIQSVNYNSGPLFPWMSQTLLADANEHWFISLTRFYIWFYNSQTDLWLIIDFPCGPALLQKKDPGKMCSLQTCVDVSYYFLKVKSLTFWLWVDFCEVCFWEKNMLILLIHTFWFICQLYSKLFLKKADYNFISQLP